MYLIIDAGNTCLKFYLFDNDKMIIENRINYDTFFCTETILQYPIDNCIICNVSYHSTSTIAKQFHIETYMEFSHKTRIPIQNNYETPNTLGLDRLAAAIGAEYFVPHKNKVIIDMGTAITIDFVDDNATYQGGNISLGMSARLRALSEYTGKLPLISPSDTTSLFGKNTVDAINNGVINGICSELNDYINIYQSQYQDITVFLTGGDSLFFEKRLKNAIFATENLVAIGLFYILKFNEK